MTARVLYVEDDDDLRRMFQLMLQSEGYDVVGVSNAEDAILHLQREHYDVLLTDFNLLNKNADWMLEVARKSGALHRTAVVILTADTAPPGVDGYRLLRKPVDVSVLFAAIDEAIANEAMADAGAEPVAAGHGVRLTLYVTRSSRASKKAFANLNRILDRFDRSRVHLEICDVAAGHLPADALEADRIVVTPTLVRSQPLPKIWVYGDLSDVDVVEDMISSGLHTASSADAGDS